MIEVLKLQLIIKNNNNKRDFYYILSCKKQNKTTLILQKKLKIKPLIYKLALEQFCNLSINRRKYLF